MQSYLAEKNFMYLYLYKMFYRGSTAPIHIFTGTGLVAMGAPISSVFLFYALTIGIITLSVPFGVSAISRFGIAISGYLSVLCRLLFFICLLCAEYGNHNMLWLGAIFYGCSYGIFPVKDILEAAFIKGDDHRGKQMTMGIVLSGGMVATVVAISGILLSIYGFVALIVLSVFLQSCSIFILSKMKAGLPKLDNHKIVNTYKIAIIEKPLKGAYLMIWAQQLIFTGGVFVLPLYMFNIIGDMQSFAMIAAGAAFVEVIVMLLFGRFFDKSVLGGIERKSAIMSVLSSIFIIFCMKTPLTALFADSFNKISANGQAVTVNISVQKILRAKNKNLLLMYSGAWLMTYTFFELLLLLVLALVFHCYDVGAFTVAFSIAAFGGLLNYYNFSVKKVNKQEIKDGT